MVAPYPRRSHHPTTPFATNDPHTKLLDPTDTNVLIQGEALPKPIKTKSKYQHARVSNHTKSRHASFLQSLHKLSSHPRSTPTASSPTPTAPSSPSSSSLSNWCVVLPTSVTTLATRKSTRRNPLDSRKRLFYYFSWRKMRSVVIPPVQIPMEMGLSRDKTKIMCAGKKIPFTRQMHSYERIRVVRDIPDRVHEDFVLYEGYDFLYT